MVVKISGKAILLTIAIGGIGLTAYLSAKKAPEAAKRKEAALKEKRERTGDPNAQLTFMESMQAQIGSYIPAMAAAAVAIGGIAGSEVLNEKTFKKVEKAFDGYKEMTDKLEGKGTSKVIERAVEQKAADDKKKKPWDIKEEFCITFQGKVISFKATRSEVIEAFYEVNRYFHGRGIVTFNEFLSCLPDVEPVEQGDDRGWEAYVGESVYGYTWIDFGLKECYDKPWITEIYMPVYPHFFDQEDCELEIEEGVEKLKLNMEKGANDGEG